MFLLTKLVQPFLNENNLLRWNFFMTHYLPSFFFLLLYIWMGSLYFITLRSASLLLIKFLIHFSDFPILIKILLNLWVLILYLINSSLMRKFLVNFRIHITYVLFKECIPKRNYFPHVLIEKRIFLFFQISKHTFHSW